MVLEKRFKDFEKALSRFREAYTKAKEKVGTDDYFFFRDSSIQRFEFTVEIFWKFIKRLLKEKEGIDCKTPKSCIRKFFSAGYLDENKTKLLLHMIDDRNLTSHTYKEEIAEDIFSRFEKYIPILEEIILKMKKDEIFKSIL